MPGKLSEPKVVTDVNNHPVCILPKGFYLSDDRWEIIWQAYEAKNESLTIEDLQSLFPDEITLQQKSLKQTGELDLNP